MAKFEKYLTEDKADENKLDQLYDDFRNAALPLINQIIELEAKLGGSNGGDYGLGIEENVDVWVKKAEKKYSK